MAGRTKPPPCSQGSVASSVPRYCEGRACNHLAIVHATCQTSGACGGFGHRGFDRLAGVAGRPFRVSGLLIVLEVLLRCIQLAIPHPRELLSQQAPQPGLALPGGALLSRQELVSSPLWMTFASSAAGVWRGVGGCFSPITAAMEPMSIGAGSERLYDAFTTCSVEPRGVGRERDATSGSLQRVVRWRVGNAAGELSRKAGGVMATVEGGGEGEGVGVGEARVRLEQALARGGGEEEEGWGEEEEEEEDGVLEEERGAEEEEGEFEGGFEEVEEMEDVVGEEEEEEVADEDELTAEPGLIYFEDGSYSRGPLRLLPDDDEEDDGPGVLVKGGHTRLRLQQTLTVDPRGEAVQLLRVALYEEEWMGPCHMASISASGGEDLVPLSARRRLSSTEVAGKWKVFETTATLLHDQPIDDDNDDVDNDSAGVGAHAEVVYTCKETLKERGLPKAGVRRKEEWGASIDDVSILWLPGGVSVTLDITEKGTLLAGVGWLSDEGSRLYLERVYDSRGLLQEVRSGSEVKGGWVGGRM
eukprot:jgi/Mesen1/7865/ME000042S07310